MTTGTHLPLRLARLTAAADGASLGIYEPDKVEVREDDLRAVIAAYRSEGALTGRLVAEFSAERVGLLSRIADLRDALRRVMGGDFSADADAAANSALARTKDHVADHARAEVQDLLRRASEVPGLTAALDEARHAQAAKETP